MCARRAVPRRSPRQGHVVTFKTDLYSQLADAHKHGEQLPWQQRSAAIRLL